MCREIPLFQKTCWTNCSKGTYSKYISLSLEEETDVVLHNRTVHAIHPSHEINNIHFMKSTRLHIKYREDKIFALGSRDINDYVETWYWETVKQKTCIRAREEKDWEINLIYSVKETEMSSVTAWKKKRKKQKSPQRKKMCIKYLTNVFTRFLNLIKMSTCSRNSPLKKCYIYNLYNCI